MTKAIIQRIIEILEPFPPDGRQRIFEAAKAFLQIDQKRGDWSIINEDGWYWWWRTDRDQIPVPLFVSKSLKSETTPISFKSPYFVNAGQLGLTRPISTQDLGGYWSQLDEPVTPKQ